MLSNMHAVAWVYSERLLLTDYREGRLVLGDGVAYAAEYLDPSVIIDLATLTGAQAVATGQVSNPHPTLTSSSPHPQFILTSSSPYPHLILT